MNEWMPCVKIYSQWTVSYHNLIPHFHTVSTAADKKLVWLFPIDWVWKDVKRLSRNKDYVDLPIFPLECMFNFFVLRYDIILQQSVGTEDVFIGLSGKDPSSMCCEAMLVILYSTYLSRTLIGGKYVWSMEVRGRIIKTKKLLIIQSRNTTHATNINKLQTIFRQYMKQLLVHR